MIYRSLEGRCRSICRIQIFYTTRRTCGTQLWLVHPQISFMSTAFLLVISFDRYINGMNFLLRRIATILIEMIFDGNNSFFDNCGSIFFFFAYVKPQNTCYIVIYEAAVSFHSIKYSIVLSLGVDVFPT